MSVAGEGKGWFVSVVSHQPGNMESGLRHVQVCWGVATRYPPWVCMAVPREGYTDPFYNKKSVLVFATKSFKFFFGFFLFKNLALVVCT